MFTRCLNCCNFLKTCSIKWEHFTTFVTAANVEANVALKLKALGKALPRFDDVDPDHFMEKYETKEGDALLHNITDPVTLSEWKRIQMENGDKKISFLT